ncbi:MAG: FG-GAP-like repeat-containing protein, partial [Cyclobacteriaceae bacterium]
YAGDGAGGFAAAVPTGSSFSGFDYLEGADIDKDGDLDLVGAGSTHGFTSTGAGDGTFGPRTFVPEGGVISITNDFDADGNLDIVTTKKNKIIYYPGDGTGDYYTRPYHRIQLDQVGRGIAVADWDKDGNLDFAVTESFSAVGGYLQVVHGKGNGYFKSQYEYPTPNNPRGLTTDDFNEDGLEDLAVVADGNLIIYSGQADGTFVKLSTQLAGAFPYDIEALHINADVHADLAVLDVTGNTVNLFSGDGTGAFVPAGNVAITADFDLHVDDVNGDNKDDLILTGLASESVQVFKGNGDDTFSLLIDIPMGDPVYYAFSANIDGDVNRDLAVLFAPTAGPRQVRFFAGDGLGGFTPVSPDLSLPNGGQTLTKGDFNNDGKIDFLSLASDGDIFIGNGDFTFNYFSTNIGVSLVERSTAVADIDGDGFVDLISGSDCSACSSGGRLQVNRGIGDGTFSPAFWSKSQVGGYRMIVSDFNNDGKDDIASLENNTDFDGLSIVLNTSGPPPCDVPNITVNPVSTTLCEDGPNHVLFVNATGTVPLTYQWQKDGVNIQGALNSPSYTLSNYTQANAGTYRCIVTNNCGNDTSSGAIIVINDTPGDPTTTDSGECGTALVTLVASGATDGNYRWYDVAVGGVALAGEVNGSFTTPLLSATKSYYVSISNGTCESGRVEVEAIITNPIAITMQPESKSANIGDDLTFSVTATGDNASYQWQKDGVDLVGKTATSLTISNVTEGDEGSYTCAIFNACNSVTSNSVALSILITGVEQFEAHSIHIYPNPSNGNLSVQNYQSGALSLMIHSLHGKELYSSNINSSTTSIDLSHLGKGLYVLTLSNGKALMRKKIVIDR